MSGKLKILVVGPYPPPYSGPETSIKLLMESPLAEWANVRLFNINFRKDMASKGHIDWTAFKFFFRLLAGLFGHIIAFRPRIVYYYVTATTKGWLLKDFWVILISRLLLRKTVIHMRAGHFRFQYDQASPLSRWLIAFACRRCQACLVQGEALRNQFAGIVPDGKIHVVPNMIDVDKYHNPAPERYEPHRIFFMGVLSYAKGYCDLLAVMPEICARFPDCRFVFAGYPLKEERNIFQEQTTGAVLTPESPKEAFERYVRGRCEKHYQCLGPIDEAAKIAEFEKCSIFVLPSYSEGFSMAVLEALSMSRPVICTPVGALGEVVGDRRNGLIIQAGDRQGLAAAICRLWEDTRLRQSMVDANHRYVSQHYSQATVAGKLLELFRKLSGADS